MDIKICIFIGLITLLNLNVNARHIQKTNSHFHREYDMHDEYLARKVSLKISHADHESAETCEDGKCKNGAKSTDDANGKKFCKCKDGSSGDFYEIVEACNVDKFKYCNGTNGTCVLADNTDGAKCECSGKKKFDDNINECRAMCEDEDCKNGGTCMADTSGKKFCMCRGGSNGDLCENVPACKDKKFDKCKEPNGACVIGPNPNEANCECSGAKIFDHKMNECRERCYEDEDEPCENLGTCQNKFCTCLKGTYGDKCERVYGCLEGKYKNCHDERGSCAFDKEKKMATCECKRGKKLAESAGYCRETCEDGNCKNGGECRGDKNGIKFCKCRDGSSGDFCQTVPACYVDKFKYCKGANGTCALGDNPDEAKCECSGEKEFDDKMNECRGTCDENEECQNGAECKGNFCECKRGSSGDFCETVTACHDPKFKYCKGENGTCVLDDTDGGRCDCNGGKKFDNEINECRKTCEDDTNCKNGAVCTADSKGTKFCKCRSGSSGDSCEIVPACDGGKFKYCKPGNGTCVLDETDRAICDCYGGKKFDVKMNECRGTCDEEAKCQNGAACIADRNGTKFCRCRSGSSGDFCKFITSCDNPKFRNCKGENGTCVVDIKGARCQCKGGKKFDEQMNECRGTCDEAAKCQNGGVCIADRNGTKFCRCRSGSSGDFCKFITSCDNPKFKNCKGENGTCVVDMNGARCDCKGGKKFYDQVNECRDLCTQNPCLNGGTCLLSGNTFKCICKENFSGDKCESRAVTISFILQLAILSVLVVIFIVHISSLVFRSRCW